MTIQLYAVLVSRTRSDGFVLAEADGHTVRWRPRDGGWTCDCLAPGGAGCVHVDAVAALIHPEVQHRMTTQIERGTQA